MRTIAFGDIHGCHLALNALIEAIRPESEDLLIFLGDYVDRGPGSRQVIDCLLELEQHSQTAFLMGNHEIMMRQVLRGASPLAWLEVGGRATVASYGGSLHPFPQCHRNFLERLLPYFETPSHLFVHANYLPELSLDSQPEEVLFWLHLTEYLPPPHCSGKPVFCGHTPQPDGQIGRFDHLTCLDTACCSGYWLSAIEVAAGTIWQADREGRLNGTGTI